MPPNKVPPKSFTVRLNVSGVKGRVMLTKPGLFAFAFLSLSYRFIDHPRRPHSFSFLV
jgi:hypothetical protein